MLTKRGDILEMSNGDKYLVDDIKIVDNKEYIVLYSLEEGIYFIASEIVESGEPTYHILEKETALQIAKKIDENR